MTAKHGYPILAFVQFVTEFCCFTYLLAEVTRDLNERLLIRLGFIKKVYVIVGIRRRNRDIAC